MKNNKMKTKTTLILLALIFTSSIYSQIKIGVNAGATYSKFKGNVLIENADAGISFLIGASFEYYLYESLSLKTNLNYERKSFNTKIPEFDDIGFPTGGEVKITTNFDYLTLPIMAEYEFGNSKKFFVNGGPFLGFLLSTKSKADNFPYYDSTLLNKKIDIGLSFGIGTKIYLNDRSSLNIELRENLGLINISDVEVFDNGTIKTNSLNLILTWDFDI